MFAEELKSNASKKRAEENRARRRRLKAQEQRKKEPKAAVETVKEPPIESPRTAVQRAAVERQQRATQAEYVQAVIKVQAYIRQKQTQRRILDQERELLQKRLHDLASVRDLLQQTKKVDYVPPPATVTALTQQVLFCRTGLVQLVQYAILPSLHQPKDMNALWVWRETGQGRYRLQRLIQMVIETATQTQCPSPEPLVQFLHELCTTRADWHVETDMDPTRFLNLVRHYLLFASATKPIPAQALAMQQQCISKASRHQGGVLVQAALQLVFRDTSLLHLFVRQILTVPLLTWKVSDSVIQQLLATPEGASHCRLVLALQAYNETCLDHSLSLVDCPATPAQCILANLMQFLQTTPLPTPSLIVALNVMVSLLHRLPVATFTSRESAVAWMDRGDGHMQPVVLAPVILEHCKLVLLDSWVRQVWDKALVNVDDVLSHKDERDIKLEADLIKEGTSAAALAAKEARMDRSKRFWNSSKWAQKLKASVTELVTGKSEKKPVPTPSGESQDPKLLLTLAKVYATIVAKWGGKGGADIVLGTIVSRKNADATCAAETCVQSLLNTLCFGTGSLRILWGVIQSNKDVMHDVECTIDEIQGNRPVRSHTIHSGTKSDGTAALFLFLALFSHALIVTDDVEIHDMERPLPLHQLRRCVQVLKKLMYRACCVDDTTGRLKASFFGRALVAMATRTLQDLYDRSSRRPFCTPKLWIVADLLDKEIQNCKEHNQYVEVLNAPVMRVCPFLVSFKRRLKLFDKIVTTKRIEIQGVNSANPFNSNPLKKGIPVRITRGRILEDGLATMNNLGSGMRQRLNVNYYNEAGTMETGIDAGGLFKEFWTDLCAIAFDPNYALFSVTDGENTMYPSPASSAAHGSDHVILFEFLGRILGKALFEGITIHPRFTHFFLSFLRGDYNYFHMLPDLGTIDKQLYNNLMFLKTYDGDATDLCLTFSITNDSFGGNRETLLLPGGDKIDVNNKNKQYYIGLVAKHYVVDRVREQSLAFTRGLWEVIDKQWLHMFNEPELQILISGSNDGKVDVTDMRTHARYAGGFTRLDPSVHRFWSVMTSFNSKQQAELLRFVTSCERPPPLGFASLNPPFTIQRVGILRDGDKLPSASTCFNILKLPTYSSERVLKERLLFAIQSGAGFELS